MARATWPLSEPRGASVLCCKGQGAFKEQHKRGCLQGVRFKVIIGVWSKKCRIVNCICYFRKLMYRGFPLQGCFPGIRGCWPLPWSLSWFCRVLHGISNLSPRWRRAWSESERPWCEGSTCGEQPSQRQGQTDGQSPEVRSLPQHRDSACDVRVQVSLPA